MADQQRRVGLEPRVPRGKQHQGSLLPTSFEHEHREVARKMLASVQRGSGHQAEHLRRVGLAERHPDSGGLRTHSAEPAFEVTVGRKTLRCTLTFDDIALADYSKFMWNNAEDFSPSAT